MDNYNPPPNPKKDALIAIESGKIHMRPKWYFVAKTALLLIGAVLTFLTALYLASLMVFILRRSGVWFAPSLGAPGWKEFLVEIPWVLILLSISFLAILQIFIIRFKFAYGRPLFYSAAIIILFSAFCIIIIDKTPFHRTMFLKAQQDQLPMAGPLYRKFGMMKQSKNLTAGTILTINPKSYIILTPKNERLEVFVSSKTQMPPKENLEIGDGIIVFGKFEDDKIQAGIIKEITGQQEWDQPPPRFMMNKINP